MPDRSSEKFTDQLCYLACIVYEVPGKINAKRLVKLRKELGLSLYEFEIYLKNRFKVSLLLKCN